MQHKHAKELDGNMGFVRSFLGERSRLVKQHAAACVAKKRPRGQRHCSCPTVSVPIGPGTQRKELQNLRTFFAFFVDNGIVKNPATKVKPPSEKSKPTLPYTQIECGGHHR